MATRQDEFERIAMPHSRSLLRVACRLTSDAAEAEDLVQETLLLAWRNFRQFRSGTNARAWLFRILLNAFYAHGRKCRTPQATFASTAETEVWPEPVSVSSAADTEDVARALAALHLEHRTVLLLGVVEGFTCREIAEMLSIPIGTVMSRLNRARQAIARPSDT
ncbi:MAG: sigma-70 family RNA polymerase sigma factor [Bryobacteraceae bacterium]